MDEKLCSRVVLPLIFLGFQRFLLAGPQHVPTYHEWMKDPDLLEATGSEPLSFAEELLMQKSWYQDAKKCTFIVHSVDTSQEEVTKISLFSVQQNLHGMVGDVNLFLSDIEDESEGGRSSNDDLPRIQAEVDIMIADKAFQKKGLGRAAACAMLIYGMKKLEVQRFFCKINDDNEASLTMFKSLGFKQCDYAECFKQYELDLNMPLSDSQLKLLELHGAYREVSCPLDDDEP
jgi:RimJ/RimL family protein N-acetyltransferase